MTTQPPKTIWFQWSNPFVFVNGKTCITLAMDKIYDDDLEYHLVESTEPCEWHEDIEDRFITSCGKAYWFDGEPNKQDYKFCNYCGKPIKFVREEEEDDA